MSPAENNPAGASGAPGVLPAAPASDLEARLAQTEDTLDRLQRLFQFVLVTLILFFIALSVFLFNQVRVVRGEAYGVSRLVTEMQGAVNDFRTNVGPRIVDFSSELHRFAETHPDFAPVMARYPKAAPPKKATNAPAAAPAPVAPAAPAKKK